MRSTICGMILFTASCLSGADSSPCQAGLNQFKSGDYGAAQRILWDCVESHQQNATHAFHLALTYRALKNYDDGLSRTKAALERSPEDVDLLYLAAFLRYRRNETKDSMMLLSKAYRLAPKDWRVHQLFALNYISFDMLEPARLSLLQAIALNPENAELHYQLGRLYFTLNRFKDSIESMKSALAITPDYPEVYDSLGLTYEALQDEKRAAESYLKAIELDRKHGIRDEWPLINYGKFLLHQESPGASLPFLSEALQFNPLSTMANYQMGRALSGLRRNPEAEKYFEKTIQLEPSFSSAYYQLATLIRNRGDRDRATALMAQFKALVDKKEKTGTSSIPSR
jgi:tetratricopeptide (TPR) repeat protein